jgi:hypothetical protein
MKGKYFKEPLFHMAVNGEKTQFREIIKPQPKDERDWRLAKLIETTNPKEARYEGMFYWAILKDRYSITEHDNRYFAPRYKVDETVYLKERHARYHIQITAVRCERLQDISDEDCMKEGILLCDSIHDAYCGFYYNSVDGLVYESPRKAHAALIDEIHGKGTWKQNPFVWVYDFELTNASKS